MAPFTYLFRIRSLTPAASRCELLYLKSNYTTTQNRMETSSCLDLKRTNFNIWFHGKCLPVNATWQNMNTVWSSTERVQCLHHIFCKKSVSPVLPGRALCQVLFHLSSKWDYLPHFGYFFFFVLFLGKVCALLLQYKSPLDSLTQV